jgi:uncharacterized protein
MIELDTFDWESNHRSLDEKGYARLKSLLTPDECKSLSDAYNEERLYRSTIKMERYRFGRGEYKYFAYPLPMIVQKLRQQFYFKLQPIADRWMAALNIDVQYPNDYQEFLAMCSKHDQNRPTPLILHYTKDGFNTLHQDLYGEVYFPFQVVIVLTQTGRDHGGGELVFVEQVPRAQSRAEVINPQQGEAIIFTTNFRPAKGSKGFYRTKMKHGVSPVTAGERYALGIIFHDAT